MTVEAFFLPRGMGTGDRCFCVFHAVNHRMVRARVLYVHPFAEEMNKARRMTSLQSRALAAQGVEVLLVDLRGCGDSSGDFGEASWQDWLDDVERAARWLLDRGPAPLWLWGLRAGALLAQAAVARLGTPANLLLWQPELSGADALRQFLRLKLAGEWASGDVKSATQSLRADIAAGRAVEVAGYRLSAALATGLDAARLAPPAKGQVVRTAWFGVSNRQPAEWSPAAARAIRSWREAGLDVHDAVVTGPAFWQTVEIEDAPGLIDVSTSSLLTGVAA